MKMISRLLAGIAAVFAAGLLFKRTAKEKMRNRLTRIAEEGYETADDILFPGKAKTGKEKQLHYGPVLPA